MTPRTFLSKFATPLGELTLVESAGRLTGIFFEDHSPAPRLSTHERCDERPCFLSTRRWLEAYFSGSKLPKPPDYDFAAGTDPQRRVWRSLVRIPRGETITYSEVAGLAGSPDSVRAVASAIARNPLSILIPCHRVIGKNGSLTGYAGGLGRKRWLLAHEGVVLDPYRGTIPTKFLT